ncbi:MAG TPA: hypothetical protein ENN28_00395 [Candidatus Uhrbacteria bacterium]|nr:hypothetical protein [Candidatus Uhrbacteria bacterium]
MNKNKKIEEILSQTGQGLPDLDLTKEKIKIDLFRRLDLPVTEVEKKRYNISRQIFYLKLYKTAASSLILALVIFFVGGGVIYAADRSLPGDLLYPLNRQIENCRLGLAKNQDKRNQLKLEFLNKRARELQKLRQKNKLEILADKEKDLLAEIAQLYTDQINELGKEIIIGQENFIPQMREVERKIEKMERIRDVLQAEGAFRGNHKIN